MSRFRFKKTAIACGGAIALGGMLFFLNLHRQLPAEGAGRSGEPTLGSMTKPTVPRDIVSDSPSRHAINSTIETGELNANTGEGTPTKQSEVTVSDISNREQDAEVQMLQEDLKVAAFESKYFMLGADSAVLDNKIAIVNKILNETESELNPLIYADLGAQLRANPEYANLIIPALMDAGLTEEYYLEFRENLKSDDEDLAFASALAIADYAADHQFEDATPQARLLFQEATTSLVTYFTDHPESLIEIVARYYELSQEVAEQNTHSPSVSVALPGYPFTPGRQR